MVFIFLFQALVLAGNSDRLQILLKYDQDPHMLRVLQKEDSRVKALNACRAQLALQVVPFSCYTVSFAKPEMLDRLCEEHAETLTRKQFSWIPRVSNRCQKVLSAQKKRMDYIQEKESPALELE